MREHKDPGTIGGIGVVVLTYEADAELLERCLGSIVATWESQPAGEPQTALIDVVVVDNDSPSLRAKTKALTERLAAQSGAPLRFVPLARNFGFAGGINRGVEFLDTRVSMVFLLNPDAEVEPDAIRRCGEALLNAPLSTVSAAPKMLLSRSTAGDADADGEFVIDAVANAINAKGEAFNIGLGQPDLGQYDTPTACFGPCFGAALIRRSAFGSDQVGALDESLFLYYEDVEWNWRAQILGFDSVTVPEARVTHVMSSSTRDRPYDFKFRLTERNLLIAVVVCVPGLNAFGIIGRRMLGLILGSLKGHYPLPGLRAVGGVAWRLPGLLRRRHRLQSQRRRSHAAILSFGEGERTFFDAVRYQPIDRAGARAFAEARKPTTDHAATHPAAGLRLRE